MKVTYLEAGQNRLDLDYEKGAATEPKLDRDQRAPCKELDAKHFLLY